MNIHYEKKADHLTITFDEEASFGKDVVVGNVCLTFSPNGTLTEIEIGEASQNGELILRSCNVQIEGILASQENAA